MLDMITVGYKSTKMGFGSCIACINALLMCRRTWGYANGSKWSHFQESMVYCVHECFMFEHSHRTSNQPTSSNIGIWTNIIWRTLVSRNPRIGIPRILCLDYKYLWLSHSFERYESHGTIIPSNKSEQNMLREVWWPGEMIQDVTKTTSINIQIVTLWLFVT